MKKLGFLGTILFTASFLIAQGEVETSIYSAEKIELVTLWKRVADKSFRLRSVEAAEISPDEKHVASGSKFGYSVMVWNTVDGTLKWENKHDSEVECITFSPDSKYVASGGEDYRLNIWQAESGELLHSLEHKTSLDGLAWSNNGKKIATGTEDGTIYFWITDSFELEKTLKVGSTINSLQFTNDDKRILVGGNYQNPDPKTGRTIYTGFTKLVDVGTQKVVREFGGNSASVKSVRISSNEKLIAAGSFDMTASLYDMETGKLLHRFEEPNRIEAVAFSPDNQFLLTGGHGDSIKFYRLTDYSLVHEEPLPRTEYLHFSDDGRLLLTSHEDSGLLALHLMVSDTQAKQGFYQRLADKQLNNKDLKPNGN